MNLHSPEHPIWFILSLTVCISALTLLCWLNATTFNHTEFMVILGMIPVFIAALKSKEITKSLISTKDP